MWRRLVFCVQGISHHSVVCQSHTCTVCRVFLLYTCHWINKFILLVGVNFNVTCAFLKKSPFVLNESWREVSRIDLFQRGKSQNYWPWCRKFPIPPGMLFGFQAKWQSSPILQKPPVALPLALIKSVLSGGGCLILPVLCPKNLDNVLKDRSESWYWGSLLPLWSQPVSDFMQECK